jgi:uncharacterized protein YegL
MLSAETIERLAASNPEPRCPVIIVADTSASMVGERIGALNAALPLLKTELVGDPLAAKRVELAVMSISPVSLVADFANPAAFSPPSLAIGTDTPMGAAMREALTRIRERVRLFQKEGVRVYRPWIVLISDGEPTDDIAKAASELREADRAGEVNVFAIGVAGADLTRMAPFTHRKPPLPLAGLKFAELFEWITGNLMSVTRSATHSAGAPKEAVQLSSVRGWADA